MGKKRKRALDATLQRQGSTAPSRRTVTRLAYGSAYLLIASLCWPTLEFGPILLDDAAQLAALSGQPFAQVFEYDRFGHLRPVKSALFWAIAQRPESVAAWRFVLLAMYLAAAAFGQRVATAVLRSGPWALLVILCWALNPASVSVLSWLSAANHVFAVLGILAYVLFAEAAGRAEAPRWVAGLCTATAIFSLALAIGSHQLALAAPVLWYAFHRSVSARTMSRGRVTVLLAASAACLVALAFLHLVARAPTTDYRFAEHPGWQLILSAPRYLLENLRLWFWLDGRFGVLLTDAPGAQLASSIFCWFVAAAACVFLWRLKPFDRAFEFALVWSAALLLPVVNLIPVGNTPVAVHYLYLPGLGLALLLVRGAQLAMPRLSTYQRPLLRWLPALAVASLIVAWLPEQRRALASWSDARRLFERTVSNYPLNIEARVNLVAQYLAVGDYAAAERLLQETQRLAPDDQGVVANQFHLLAQTGRSAEALALQDAHPGLQATAQDLVRRGLMLERLDRHTEAAAAYQKALDGAAQPDVRFAAGYQLAITLVRTSRISEARALIDRLLQEFPDRPELLMSKRLLSAPGVQ
jgi:tetratricopeptide (TPR) repeat protein